MAIAGVIEQREYDKFVESPTRAGKTAVEIFGSVTSFENPFGIPSNSTVYTYATGTAGIYFTEVYSFYESGTPIAPVNLLKTITIYYSDSKLKNEVGGVVT